MATSYSTPPLLPPTPAHPAARLKAATSARRVIDLTDDRHPASRMADYEAAFGLPSALHEHPHPVVERTRGITRLGRMTPRRERH